MKKVLSWLLSLVILSLIVGAIIFAMNSNARAAAKAVPNVEVPQIVQNQDVSSEMQEKQLAYVEQVQALSEKWANKYHKAGWIHVVAHETLDTDTQNTAPDGSIAPNEFITDDWILLDDKGYEVKGIFIQRNLQGDVIQVSVLKDKSWNNLTYGDAIPAPDNLVFTLDFGFPELSEKLKDTLEKTSVEIKGKKLIKFIAKEKYQTPSKLFEFSALVSSINTEAVYDEDGTVVLFQAIAVMEDGSERIRDSIEITTVETAAKPPLEILN